MPAPTARIVTPGQGPSVAVVGDVYSFLATGDDTGGAYSLWHAVVSPGGGPPPHVHRREDESFYVLEGDVAFHADGQDFTAGPGTFVDVPRGSLHSFRNNGSRPARMLIQVAPAGLEKMFLEIGQPVAGPDATPPPVTKKEIDHLLKVAPRYGLEIHLNDGP